MFISLFQDQFPSIALKTLISVSTVILLGLIVAYHSLEIQVYSFAAVIYQLNLLFNQVITLWCLIEDVLY